MRFLAPGILVFIFGCASFRPTPYQAQDQNGGYTERELEKNNFVVSFRGNGHTPKSSAEDYAPRRAAELCSARGFKSMQIVSKEDLSTQHRRPSEETCFNAGSYVCDPRSDETFEKPLIEVSVRCTP